MESLIHKNECVFYNFMHPPQGPNGQGIALVGAMQGYAFVFFGYYLCTVTIVQILCTDIAL